MLPIPLHVNSSVGVTVGNDADRIGDAAGGGGRTAYCTMNDAGQQRVTQVIQKWLFKHRTGNGHVQHITGA